MNFKYPKKGVLRVIDEDPVFLFERLKIGDELSFVPIPEPDPHQYVEEVGSEETPEEAAGKEGHLDAAKESKTKLKKPPVLEYAKKLNFSTDYDLRNRSGDDQHERHKDSDIQTLLYAEDLESTLTTIMRGYKTLIEETGNNSLYFVFGMLEYFDSEESAKPLKAPLILFPVHLSRRDPRIGEAFYRYCLAGSDDGPSLNLTLVEKLKREYNILLPALPDFGVDSDTTENWTLLKYLTEIEELLVRVKPRWQVAHEVNLGTLNFGKSVLLDDLKPEKWKAASTNIEDHPLVQALCDGIDREESETSNWSASDYPIDDLAANKVPELIYDADSSQHSALVDALSGKNIVIEGPPGTGKSQTITNLIAAALNSGKTVLFVAEKLAALEVVKKRLDNSGLGEFCLELHSTKVQKKSVIESLKQRLELPINRPKDLETKKIRLTSLKTELSEYSRTIQKNILGFNYTLADAIGKVSKLKSELEQLGVNIELFSQIGIPVDGATDERFFESLETVRKYFSHRNYIESKFGRYDRHPWSMIGESVADTQSMEFVVVKTNSAIRLLESILDTQQALESAIAPLIADVTPSTIKTLASWSPKFQSVLTVKLSERMLDAYETISGLDFERYRKLINEFIEVSQSLKNQGVKSHIDSDMDFLDVDNARKAFSDIKCNPDANLASVSEYSKALSSFTTLISHIHSIVSTPEVAEHIDPKSTLKDLISFLNAMTTGSRLPDHRGDLDRAKYAVVCPTEFGQIRRYVETAKTISRELENTIFLAAATASSDEIFQKLNSFKASNWFSALFSHEQAASRKWASSIFRMQPKRGDQIAAIQKLFDLRVSEEKLKSALDRISANGDVGIDTDTDFENVANNAEILNEMAKLVNDKHKAIKIAENTQTLKKKLVTWFRHDLVNDVVKFVRLLNQILDGCAEDLSIEQLDNVFAETSKALDAVLACNIINSMSAKIPLNEISRICFELKHEYAQRRILEEEIRPLNHYSFHTSDYHLLIEEIGDYSRFMSVVSECRDSDIILPSCLPKDIFNLAKNHASEILQMEELCAKLEVIADTLKISPEFISRNTFIHLLEVFRIAAAEKDEFESWSFGVQLTRQAKGSIFADLVSLLTSMCPKANVATKISEYTFLRTVVSSHIKANPILSQFNGIHHDEIRTMFANLDRAAITLHRQEVALHVSQKEVPSGSSSGSRKTWTNMSLIKNEVSKQKGHIPIRQLVLRSGKALQALKPCFLMSPTSVAQFIGPGSLNFDLIVMDEASQLRPEDAIGAIARGKQLVIVGDSKQLPPSSFFDIGVDEQADEEEVENAESILQVAASVFTPSRQLRWHYRSRHESLIAFSNSQFYGNNLVLFPTATAVSDGLGVKYRYVANGVYQGKGINSTEASELVKGLKEIARSRPNESVGIVTMNAAQRDVIEELVLAEAKVDLVLAEFINKADDRKEGFFVKNLENVQGDERDVILISVTYGRDNTGAFHHRFGPINSKNGWRRLNVLFSRAKLRMEVFCSFEPDLINGAKSEGAIALRNFLEFARSGKLPIEGTDSGRVADSPFEESVAAAIESMGYQVTKQVGTAGYFIDIGVKHPHNSGKFILAVECDGATYHSSKSARDRDRLRQENLEGLGWKVHRIWSTDWFKNERKERLRLKEKIESLLEAEVGIGDRNSEVYTIENKISRQNVDTGGSVNVTHPNLLEIVALASASQLKNQTWVVEVNLENANKFLEWDVKAQKLKSTRDLILKSAVASYVYMKSRNRKLSVEVSTVEHAFARAIQLGWKPDEKREGA